MYLTLKIHWKIIVFEKFLFIEIFIEIKRYRKFNIGFNSYDYSK